MPRYLIEVFLFAEEANLGVVPAQLRRQVVLDGKVR